MRKLFLFFTLLFVSQAVIAQNFQKAPNTVAPFLAADSAFFLPNDTLISAKNSKDSCRRVAKQDGIVYSYNCATGRWDRLISGINLLSYARRSRDTIYFQRLFGGELAIPMDYYTKSESDNRYVRSPSSVNTESWLTAWDKLISADVPNIPNPDTKYLIVNGTQGDSVFTVSGGTGASDFTTNFAAVAYSHTANRYFTFLVIRTPDGGTTYHTDRPLKYGLSADTLRFIWDSYQGQHMTGYGYKAYADMIYDYHKNIASKDYKLYSFYPPDNPSSIPFTGINGAVQGGTIPSTSIPQVLSISTKTINGTQMHPMHYLIQQGGVAGRGVEWQVTLGKKAGYLEAWVGAGPDLMGWAKVLFYLDGVLQRTDTVRGAVQKLTYTYSNASTGKIQIVTGDTQNSQLRVGNVVWYQTNIAAGTKVYTGGKIMFVGDSWTQFPFIGIVPMQALTNRFKERYAADGGDPADVINVGRGGMTSAWGKYYLKYWLNLYHPKYVYLEFYINDANSSGFYGDPSNTTWNFSSTNPYVAGTDVDGKVTQSIWLQNRYEMSDTCLAYDAIPINLMNSQTGSLTQTQGQSGWLAALRPEKQYYDIEAFFTSQVYADGALNAPLGNLTKAVIDTAEVGVVTRGGKATVSGTYLVEAQATNSASTVGVGLYPKTTYTGSLGSMFRIWNSPTRTTTIFDVRNNGSVIATDFSAGMTGFTIPPFTITSNAGVVRFSATNSTTLNYLYLADSFRNTIRARIPLTLQNYNTAGLPISSFADKGSMAYDSLKNRPAYYDAFFWWSLAREEDMFARYDSTTAKGNFIRNSLNFTAQTANIWTAGTVRFDLGSDGKYDMFYRDSATGRFSRLAAGPFGYTLKAGPGGKPEYVNETNTFVRNQQAVIQTADYSISGNAAAAKLFSRAGTASGAMTHYGMMTTGGVRRFTFDLTGSESTSNAGSNFQLNRWDDADVSLGAALFVRRSDGFTGIGTTTPTNKFTVSGGVMYGDGIGTSIVTKNTDNTASITNETVLNCTASITQTLPDAVSGNYGKIFIINKDYSGGAVTIASNSIDGSPTYTLTDTLQSVTVISSGVSWRVVSTKIGTPAYRRATSTLAQVTTAGNTTSNSVSVGDLSTSNGTAYSTGGITAIGRNNTSGRLETFTPSPVGVVYGDGSLSTFPTGVDYLILRPTGNNTIELSSTAVYTGTAGRVALILNTTNFTYTIAGTPTSSKFVYVVWYANNTPSFINL